MRYLVSEGSIGPNGRRVRCAHCGHQWLQEPETGLDDALFAPDEGDDLDAALAAARKDEDEDDIPFERPSPAREEIGAAEEIAIDFQTILQKEIEGAPIPEGVKPVHIHEDITLPGPSAKKRALKLPFERLGGYAAAVLVWAIVLGVFLIMQPQISRIWPASNLVYTMAGLEPVPPGEGLGLDSLRAEMGEGKIRMSGEILNLKEQDVKVPSVMASIVDVDGKEIDRILIAPPVARLKAEGRVSFETVYPKIPDGAVNVNYAFSFVKTKPADEARAEEPAHNDGAAETHDGTPPTEIKAEEGEAHSSPPAHDEGGHAEDSGHEAPQHPAPHH